MLNVSLVEFNFLVLARMQTLKSTNSIHKYRLVCIHLFQSARIYNGNPLLLLMIQTTILIKLINLINLI